MKNFPAQWHRWSLSSATTPSMPDQRTFCMTAWVGAPRNPTEIHMIHIVFFWWFPCLPVFRCEALKNRHLQKGPFRPTIGCSEFNFFECPWCQPFPNTSPNTFPGLANRTAEKVKPSALDLLLLFKETVRLKQSVPGVKRSAIRDVLFACIADYNKTVSNHRAPWHKQVNDLDVS